MRQVSGEHKAEKVSRPNNRWLVVGPCYMTPNEIGVSKDFALPYLSGDVISMAKLIAKSLIILLEDDATNANATTIRITDFNIFPSLKYGTDSDFRWTSPAWISQCIHLSNRRYVIR